MIRADRRQFRHECRAVGAPGLPRFFAELGPRALAGYAVEETLRVFPGVLGHERAGPVWPPLVPGERSFVGADRPYVLRLSLSRRERDEASERVPDDDHFSAGDECEQVVDMSVQVGGDRPQCSGAAVAAPVVDR